MSFVAKWFSPGGQARYGQAIALYNERRFDEAARAFRSLLHGRERSPDPQFSLARFYLAESEMEMGRIHLRDGNLVAARAAFEAALAAGYRYPDLHLRLGRIYASLGDPEAADRSLQAALEIHEGLVEARARRALLALRAGGFDAVIGDLDRIESDGFPLPAGWRNEADPGTLVPAMEAVLEARDREEEEIRRALEAADTEPEPRARELLEAAIRRRPGYPDLRCRLGILHAEAGRLDEAETCLREAVELQPRYEEARIWLRRVRASRAA